MKRALFVCANFLLIAPNIASGQWWVPRRVPAARWYAQPAPRRGANGWYLDKKTKRWHHDGGANPDTNYNERQYLQLEDPEGVYARTKGKS